MTKSRIFGGIKKIIKHPTYILAKLSEKKIIKLDDKKYIEILYKAVFDKEINLDNPKTFNEKLQWLKLYNRNPQYTKMVDKYEVKKYISNVLGEEYVIPTLGIYESFDDIDFEKLPKQFVIKCTHDSKSIVICQDKSKLNIKKERKRFNKNLKRNFYLLGREWPYKNVVPRIIIEKLMKEDNGEELKDYKFYCFNGKVKLASIVFGAGEHQEINIDFYDLNWKKMPFSRQHPSSNVITNRPRNYNEMIKLSEKLSENIPFVRMDWYEINGKTYFGEMTFYPSSGFGKFEPEKYDKILGDMLELPQKKEFVERI